MSAIDSQLLQQHGLTAGEYAHIQELLGRDPNLLELGLFSVMWSEHCSYKSSRVHLKTLPTTGPRVVQGPGENAGAVDIGGGLAAVFKIESHNHPSFIEPYQGAATGVGGIIRDIFTMGARPVALLNALRFGSLDTALARRIFEGVVAGIGGYGNSIGIPTIGGEIVFDEAYAGNPLVNVLCLGLARHDEIIKGQATGVGNPVYYVGAKTGRDGIHGATMASAEFDESSAEKRPAVQVGDPFMEKLLMEACLEVMRTDALVGIQDMGAAGLTCATSEMSSRGGSGMDVEVSLVPQRETGMTPYEIMLSESQERMLLVARAGHEREVEEVFQKWDLHAVRVGHVTASGRVRLFHHGTLVADVPTRALTDEGPVYRRPMQRPAWQDEVTVLDLTALAPAEPADAFTTLLASPIIASKRWAYRQFDHTVGTNTIAQPGTSAGVVRIKGAPQGLALSVDGNGRHCYLDPYRGAMLAVAEAARNVACAGAEPIGGTNNLNFGNPERPEIMWQFGEAVRGIGDACRALDVPITGGNVSLYNETEGRAIYPTPVLGVVGLLADAARTVTRRFTAAGAAVVLLGENHGELGGSEYLARVHGRVAGEPPRLDLTKERALQHLVVALIQSGLALSAHDCSDGGLAITLAECTFDTGGIGVEASLEPVTDVPPALAVVATLFGESASRVVLSVDDGDLARVLEDARAAGVPARVIGRTGGPDVRIEVGGRDAIRVPIASAERTWATAIERVLSRDPGCGMTPHASSHSEDSQHMFDKFREECGVFGIYGHTEAANMAYLGLYALQHRGQESAGIATSDGVKVRTLRAMGYVAEIFTQPALATLPGHIAIGHTRYSTAGESSVANAQPLVIDCVHGQVGICHNGNIVNARELRDELVRTGSIFQTNSDTEVVLHLYARSTAGAAEDALVESVAKLSGAFSFALISKERLVAVRDPHGFRPLALGRLGDAWVVCSETCAMDLVGATYVRDVEPGEMLIIGPDGPRSVRPFPPAPSAHCIFEHVYFARPDSEVFGRSVNDVRTNLGRQLARETGVPADVVVPIPDSGVCAAIGYGEEAGIPMRFGLIRNHYVGRTFIEPAQSIRHFGVKVKLNPVRSLLKGKRVVLIDDSIVRGTTSRKIVKMVRAAGAAEVHVRISCPPTISPCFYGVDTPQRSELIAATHSIEEIRKYLDADSVAYLSLDGMLSAVTPDGGRYCTSCYTGHYPVAFPRDPQAYLQLALKLDTKSRVEEPEPVA